MRMSAADQANQQMVDRLIAEGALWSPRLIHAFRTTPRHRFLDRVFQYQRKHDRWRELLTREPQAEEIRLLYSDRALITRLSPASSHEPIVPISSSSQPSLMAQMLEDLRPEPGQRVLEIGAGTGYNAALLADVVGPKRVVSIDVDRQVLAEAWDHLRSFPERAVTVHHADGRHGYAESAPYHRIMVTAATPDLEPDWLDQLAPGGLVLAPLALAPGLAYLVRGTFQDGVLHGRLTRAAYFMPLRGEGETGSTVAVGLPPRCEPRTLPAPWAGWFDGKRPRLHWLGFSQSLAFYGWLRGLTVHYRVQEKGPAVYGVSDQQALAWLGPQEWQVSGDAGRDLGWSLWRAYLDAGGPWPIDFRLRASPTEKMPAGPGECYARLGPHCFQRWDLAETRERPVWI